MMQTSVRTVAYVGRPAHLDDLEEPFCDEDACRRVGTVSGSEQPDSAAGGSPWICPSETGLGQTHPFEL
jgi:hypothetical protein